MKHRDIGFAFIVAALLSLGAACAEAADAVERPYDPPVGSRWILETEVNSEDIRPAGTRTEQIRTRSELTIEQRHRTAFIFPTSTAAPRSKAITRWFR